MTMEDKKQLDQASEDLRGALVKALGPRLPGVTGFGPSLDGQSDNLALRVLVNSRTSRKLEGKLPRQIRGLPVRLAVAGVGRLD